MKTYFIQSKNGGPIKIGRSINVKKRLASLQTSHAQELKLLASLDGDRECELHNRFKSLRLSGEWFRNGPELVDFLRRECNCRDLIGQEPELDIDIDPWQQLIRTVQELSGCRHFVDGDDVLEFVESGCGMELDDCHDYEQDEDDGELDEDYCECESCSCFRAGGFLADVDPRAALWSKSRRLLIVFVKRQAFVSRESTFRTLSAAARELDLPAISLAGVTYSANSWDASQFQPADLALDRFREWPLQDIGPSLDETINKFNVEAIA